MLLPFQKSILASAVKELTQVASSCDSKKRLVVLCSAIIILMALEDQQKTILAVLQTQKNELDDGADKRTIRELEKSSVADWKNIDDIAKYIIQLVYYSIRPLYRNDFGDEISCLMKENCK